MTDTLQDLARRLVGHPSRKWRWLAGSLALPDIMPGVGIARVVIVGEWTIWLAGGLGEKDEDGHRWPSLCESSAGAIMHEGGLRANYVPDLTDPPTVRNVLELLRETQPEACVTPFENGWIVYAWAIPGNPFMCGEWWDAGTEGEAVARATLAEWDRLGAGS